MKKAAVAVEECVVKKERMLAALETLDQIPVRASLPTSVYVKAEPTAKGVRMYLSAEVAGYADVVPLSGKWPFAKTVWLDRRLLFSFCLAARQIKSKSDFKFRTQNGELLVASGSRKLKLATAVETAGYAAAPQGGSAVEVEPQLVAMLQRAKQCTQAEWSLQELETVMLNPEKNKLALYATTGMLFFRAEVDSALKLKGPTPFPLMLIDLLKAKSLAGIEVTQKEVVLVYKHGRLWQSMNAVARKKFPLQKFSETVAALRKSSKPSFAVYSTALSASLQRLVGYLASVRKLDWILTLQGKPQDGGRLGLVVKVSGAVFRESVGLKQPVSADVDIDWPLDKISSLLIDIAEKGRLLEVSFDKQGRAYVKAASDVEVLVPRRLR